MAGRPVDINPKQDKLTPYKLQGDDLVQAVLGSMEKGKNRIRGKTIVPAVYRIYLNPDDIHPIRDILPFIVTEIQNALDDRMARLNGSGGLMGTVRAKLRLDQDKNQFIKIAEHWTVEIYADADESLQPGDIEVVSELGAPQKSEYAAGSMTQRIKTRSGTAASVVDNGAGSAEPEPVSPAVQSDPAPAPAPPAEPVQPNDHPDTDVTRRSVTPEPLPHEEAPTPEDVTRVTILAKIGYTEGGVQKQFAVIRPQTTIGRGGKAYWVDIKLDSPPDVSREHCRIHHDAEGFRIEDLSQYGTKVNDTPVQKGSSMRLPAKATIRLAEVIDLQWEIL